MPDTRRMPGAPHESLVVLLRERPAWLAELLEAVAHRTLPAPLTVVDTAVRVVGPAELRVDLLLGCRSNGGAAWVCFPSCSAARTCAPG